MIGDPARSGVVNGSVYVTALTFGRVVDGAAMGARVDGSGSNHPVPIVDVPNEGSTIAGLTGGGGLTSIFGALRRRWRRYHRRPQLLRRPPRPPGAPR